MNPMSNTDPRLTLLERVAKCAPEEWKAQLNLDSDENRPFRDAPADWVRFAAHSRVLYLRGDDIEDGAAVMLILQAMEEKGLHVSLENTLAIADVESKPVYVCILTTSEEMREETGGTVYLGPTRAWAVSEAFCVVMETDVLASPTSQEGERDSPTSAHPDQEPTGE